MTNLHNIVVFIKDEAELQQAREILIAQCQLIDVYEFYISEDKAVNYLQLDAESNEWFIGMSFYLQQITLTELEQKLKEKHDAQSK